MMREGKGREEGKPLSLCHSVMRWVRVRVWVGLRCAVGEKTIQEFDPETFGKVSVVTEMSPLCTFPQYSDQEGTVFCQYHYGMI